MLFTWFMLAALILLFAPRSITNKFQTTFAGIFRIPITIGTNITLSSPVKTPKGDFVSRREYMQLQNHLANRTQQLQEVREKYEKAAGISQRVGLEGAALVFAYVTSVRIDGLRAEMIINRGTNDKVKPGYFVLADNSIIGKIDFSDPRTSTVKLFTDSTSRIEVKINDVPVNLIGTGSDCAHITTVTAKTDIVVDTNVFVMQKAGLLDQPMIIGKIKSRERYDENPLFWDISVEPVCDFKILKDVAVIIMNPDN